MSSVYPGALDTFTNPDTGDRLDSPNHADQHSDSNDAIEAIEGTLGVDPAGSQTDVKSRLVAMETRVSSLGLGTGPSYSFVNASTANGGDPIVLAKPTGTVDGDLLIFAAAGHNVTVNTFPSGSTAQMSYDTDGQEPIYCYTKIASSEPSSWSLDTNSSNASLSGAVAVTLRGPTTFHHAAVRDATFETAQVDGHPNGVAIFVWVSALAGGFFQPHQPWANVHVNHLVASGQPAFCIASIPTTHSEPISPQNMMANSISGTWLGNITMIWS